MKEGQGGQRRYVVELWRVVVVFALLLMGLGLWDLHQRTLAADPITLPNPASQRLEQLQLQRRTNELLEEILELLESGKLHVRVEGADNQAVTHGDPARVVP